MHEPGDLTNDRFPGCFQMKKSLLILLVLLCGMLYAADSWTVLVYMAADNNLSYQALENLQLMEEAVQPKNLNLLVQLDMPDVGGRRYLVREHPNPGIGSWLLEEMGEIDSGDKDTLSEFMRWGFRNFPSKRRMLIIWSHADSWYKNPKYIAPDNSSQSAIGVANGDLKSALVAGGKLDVLLFDACSMQSVEVLSELKDCADYIIGSSDLVPVVGFPYADMIPLMQGKPMDFASAIPQLFTDYYAPGSVNNPFTENMLTTCSAIKTDGLNALWQGFRHLAEELRDHAPEVFDLQSALYRYNTGLADIDLRQFLTILLENGILVARVQELLSALDEITIAQSSSFPFYQAGDASVALWFPHRRMNFEGAIYSYMHLDFAKTGWASFVNLALGDDDVPPIKPEILREYQRFGKLHLVIRAPIDCDRLSYVIHAADEIHEYHPPMYVETFEASFPIEEDGVFTLQARDLSGNLSEKVVGEYEYITPKTAAAVYPNPVYDLGLAEVTWFWEETDGLTSVSLYNIRGQKLGELKREFTKQNPAILKLNEIPGIEKRAPGLHFIRIKNKDQNIVQKFIISGISALYP